MLSHVLNIILVFFTLGLILLFVVAHFTRFKTNLIVIIQQKIVYTHTLQRPNLCTKQNNEKYLILIISSV